MKQFLPEATEYERRIALRENAHEIQNTKYQRPLTEDELAARREALTDNCIQINGLEDDLKEIKDQFKAKIDPLKVHNKGLLQELKTKQESVDGEIFLMANHEDGMMETYDADGMLIESRRLRPDERQGNVFQLAKAK